MSAVARAFELAWAHSQVKHGHQNGSADDAHLFQRLGAHLLFAGCPLRGPTHVTGVDRPDASGPSRAGPLERLCRSSWRGSPRPPSYLLSASFWSAHSFLRAGAWTATLFSSAKSDRTRARTCDEQISELVREAGSGELLASPAAFI